MTDCEKEVRRLRQIVKRQRAVIKQAMDYTAQIYHEAEAVMSQHQPRGTWSLWRGRGEIAVQVYKLLRRARC